MATWPDRACTALTVYYERGVRALDYIEREMWDEADSLLSMRTAAFHNFRAADYLAQKDGYSAEQEAQLRAIWGQIAANDAKLLAVMMSAREKLEGEVSRLAKVSKTLGRFRSGQVQESKWEKPV